jgi:23S rRNA (adenine-N6)-dimethyltransferase
VSAGRRTVRDWRRRRLGQNFLNAETAERLIAQADFRAGELVVEIGPGLDAMTFALARRDVRIIAVESDPQWCSRLRQRAANHPHIRIVEADFFSVALPTESFRVVGSLPFARTTDILRRLLDDPAMGMTRADVIVQWDVARKRAAAPPSTLLSTAWAPWWETRLNRRIAAREFRPIPSVDAGFLTITRRNPPLLPPSMARAYALFVRQHWPFDG